MYKGRIASVLLLVSFLFVGACTSQLMYNRADTAIKATENKIAAVEERNEMPPPPVVSKAEPYVDIKPVSFKHEPGWMKNRITVHGEKLPFALFMSKVLAGTNAVVHYQNKFDKHQLISFNFKGSVKGGLDRLAAKSGTVYEVDDNSIHWKSIVTKRFSVSFMPGGTDYLLGRTSGSLTEGGGGGDAQIVTAKASTDEFSNIKGPLSLWKDLEESVKNLLSEEGKAQVSQFTTSVTVTDHIENIRGIERYLAQLNEDLSRQVVLKVVVLDISLNKEYVHGINWDLIRQNLGKQFMLSGDFTNLSPSGDTLNFASFTVQKLEQQLVPGTPRLPTQSRGGQSEAMIEALEKQGNVSIVTRPQVTTLNNQVAELNITNQRAYLASIETTLNDNQSSTALEPGIVTSGFTLFALPKIQGDKVYLQITSSLSNLVAINEFSTQVAGVGNQTAEARIQTPELDEKYFNQRTMLRTGETLILSGFKETRNRANKAALFGADSLGGKGADRNTRETILLITPYIVWGDHHPHILHEDYVRKEYS